MNTDLFMVVGLGVMMLSIPSAISAFADRRFPLVALIVVALGAASFAYGWQTHGEPMTLAEVPHVIIRVLARVIP